jgi:hypothetical protein
LGNRNEEDSRFLHNLLINIEITRNIANLFPITVTLKLDNTSYPYSPYLAPIIFV